MIDSAKELAEKYYNQLLDWYYGLSYVEQFFTLFGVFVAVAIIAAMLFVKKATS